MPLHDLVSLGAVDGVLVQDFVQIPNLVLGIPQRQTVTVMVPVVVESVRDDGYGGAPFQEGPGKIEIVWTSLPDSFIDPTDFQESLLLEKQEVLQVCGLLGESAQALKFLRTRRSGDDLEHLLPIAAVSAAAGTDDIGVEGKAGLNGPFVQPIVRKKEPYPGGGGRADPGIECRSEALAFPLQDPDIGPACGQASEFVTATLS
jgi:hypothetical protein